MCEFDFYHNHRLDVMGILPGQKMPSPSFSDQPILECIFLRLTSSMRMNTGAISQVNLPAHTFVRSF